MSELKPHGRALLDAVRRERTPLPGAHGRVLGAVLEATTLTTVASAAATPSLLGKALSGAGKWWLAGGLSVIVASGALSLRRESPRPAAATTAAAPPPAPPNTTNLTTTVPSPSTSVSLLPARSPAQRPRPQSTSATATTLEQELRELHDAHASYRHGNAAQALLRVRQHQARFPKSQLGLERSVLEVLSLCRLGRTAQAQSLAAQLGSRAPGSAALAGLEGSCAAPKK